MLNLFRWQQRRYAPGRTGAGSLVLLALSLLAGTGTVAPPPNRTGTGSDLVLAVWVGGLGNLRVAAGAHRNGRHRVPASRPGRHWNGGSTTQPNRDWGGVLRSSVAGSHWHARAATQPDRNGRHLVPASGAEWSRNRHSTGSAHGNGCHRIPASRPGRNWNRGASTQPYGNGRDFVPASVVGGHGYAHAAAQPHRNRRSRVPASGAEWGWTRALWPPSAAPEPARSRSSIQRFRVLGRPGLTSDSRRHARAPYRQSAASSPCPWRLAVLMCLWR